LASPPLFVALLQLGAEVFESTHQKSPPGRVFFEVRGGALDKLVTQARREPVKQIAMALLKRFDVTGAVRVQPLLLGAVDRLARLTEPQGRPPIPRAALHPADPSNRLFKATADHGEVSTANIHLYLFKTMSPHRRTTFFSLAAQDLSQ
jgi:hypothetical protein